jgi:hypothetical protein
MNISYLGVLQQGMNQSRDEMLKNAREKWWLLR